MAVATPLKPSPTALLPAAAPLRSQDRSPLPRLRNNALVSGKCEFMGARLPCLESRRISTGCKNVHHRLPVLRSASETTQETAVSKDDGISVEEVPIEKRYPEFPTVLDINQIRNILPHRFPFLLVDRVIEYNPGQSAVAIKNVTINDNFFPGHFPERPIMPGVLMIEAMAQVGGIIMLTPEVGGSKENFFFGGVDKVRFRKPVVAGDTLLMKMNLLKLNKKFGIAKMEGKAFVGGQVVCEGEFLMVLGKSSE